MGKEAYSRLSVSEGLGQEVAIVQTLQTSVLRQGLACCFYLLTLGLGWAVCSWQPKWQAKFLYVPCEEREARVVLVRGRDGSYTIVEVEQAVGEMRFFKFRKQTYYWEEAGQRFKRLQYEREFSGAELQTRIEQGLTTSQADQLLRLYGPNTLNIDITSVKSLLWAEASSPFFLFQIFSVVLWIYEDYVLYSLVILGTLLVSLVTAVRETRQALVKVQQVAAYSTQVRTLRDGEVVVLPSESLVPGDVIFLDSNWKVPCDFLLSRGSLIVNEGLLTGESLAVWKTPLSDNPQTVHSPNTLNKQHIVHCGTTIVHMDPQASGLVLATGFQTLQGEVLSAILYPKPCRFKFEKHSILFVSAFAVIAFVGMLFCVRSFLREHASLLSIVVTVLDMLTIAIPPALPLAMSIGATLAAGRLAQVGISCSLRQAINPAGRVSAICFDKTGTLTEDSMLFAGALACVEGQFRAVDGALKEVIAAEIRNCVATCQGLSRLQGEVAGDPQELTIQRKLGFDLVEEPGRREVTVNATTLRILHLYHFSPELKRMAAVVEASDQVTLYVKGAPEVITPRCLAVPADYEDTLHAYSSQGYRVLACASKPLATRSVPALLQDLDSELTFLGLIVFHNPLKPGVGVLIDSLKSANIQIIVSTGDHVVTGLAAARGMGLLSSALDTYIGDVKEGGLEWEKVAGTSRQESEERSWADRAQNGDSEFAIALTGNALQVLFEESQHTPFSDLDQALSRLAVCGRMSPAHKVLLIEELQRRGHIVAMCGDGANDCGALKTADVGVSVGDSGSAIAAAFCGSAVGDVEVVLREGRAALASSFQCFKFVALYSLVQFLSVNVLYLFETCILDFQFLYVDLATILPLAFALSQAKAWPQLAKRKPTGSLLATSVLVSIAGVAFLQFVFLVLTVSLVLLYGFPQTVGSTIDLPKPGAVNSAVFLVSNFQYLIVCLAFSEGPPFRESLFRNWLFLSTISLVLAGDLYLLFTPAHFLSSLLQLYSFPLHFQLILLLLIAANAVLTLVYEKCLVHYISRQEHLSSL